MARTKTTQGGIIRTNYVPATNSLSDVTRYVVPPRSVAQTNTVPRQGAEVMRVPQIARQSRIKINNSPYAQVTGQVSGCNFKYVVELRKPSESQYTPTFHASDEAGLSSILTIYGMDFAYICFGNNGTSTEYRGNLCGETVCFRVKKLGN